MLFIIVPAPLDDVPCLYGPPAQHDLPMRSRNVSDVRRPHVRVPYLSQGRGEEDPTLLREKEVFLFSSEAPALLSLVLSLSRRSGKTQNHSLRPFYYYYYYTLE